MLALFLLVTGVRTNHAHDAITTNNFTVAANLLYRRLHSHINSFQSSNKHKSVIIEGILWLAKE